MSSDFLKGVYNITPTPFHADGSLDLESLSRLTEFTISAGVHGMTILGVLGEATKLTEGERDQVIATVIETANARIPICVGTSHAATDGCVAYSKRAEELGAQAVMIEAPRLTRPNNEAVRRHYLSVAGAIELPIVVQDYPPSSGVHMSADFIAGLAAESPACRWLKLEDEPTPRKVSLVLAANPDVRIFGGLGAMMFLEELRHGAIGTMTGFAFPEILVDIYSRWAGGDRDGAADVFYRACALIRFESQALINLPLRKEIYRRRGAIAEATARQPAATLDAGTLDDLVKLVDWLGMSNRAKPT